MGFRDLILRFCLCAFAFSSLECSPFPSQNEIKDDVFEGIVTKAIPKGVASFSLDLLKKLARERPGENVLYSPISAYTALMMLHLGSGDKTREELKTVLKFSEKDTDYSQSEEKLQEAFSEVLSKVEHKHSGSDDVMPEAIISNGFFVQKDRPIRDTFLQTLHRYYDANVTNVDFQEHAREATDFINSYISEKTKQRIQKLYDSPLPSTTVSVLASALYFNGIWQDKFEETEVEKFNTGVSQIDVPMMRNQKVISYTSIDSLLFDSIELQYRGGEYAMYIMLPRPSQTLKNLTEHLHSHYADEMNRNTRVVGVDYKIPKMKFSWKNSLTNPLELEDVFRHADLSRMTAEKVPISDMLQATEIEVDEHGTTATAATSVSSNRRLTPPVKTEVKFYVDRPFIVTIIHKPTQMRLFQGAVYKPQQ